MGIWGTSASPIGYAYQSAQGSGINIKPIDPRAFQVDSGSTQRSGRSSNSDNDEKYEAQYGTRRALEEYGLYLDAQESMIEHTFNEKILPEKNKDVALKLQQNYVADINKISQQRMYLSIAKQNAEFAHDEQVATTTTLKDKDLLGEIGLEVSLGNVDTGTQLLSKFFEFGFPFSYDANSGRLLTNEKRQNAFNRGSGMYIDENGRIETTEYKAPALNVSSSKKANDEILGIIKGTDGNFTRNYNEFVPGGEIDHDYSDNQLSLDASANNIWYKVSEDTKNYAFSSALEMGIGYHSGVKKPVMENGKELKDKHGKVIMSDIETMTGHEAVTEITTSIKKARKLKKGDPEQDKLIDRAKRISDGIVGTAQNYLVAMANNDTIGLRRLINNTTLKKDNNGENGGGTQSKEVTEYMSRINTAEETPLNILFHNNGKDSFNALVSTDGSSTTKTFDMKQSDKVLQLGPLGFTNLKAFQDANYSLNEMQGDYMFNGIMLNTDLFKKNNGKNYLKDMKVVNLGNKGYLMPSFYSDTDGDNIMTKFRQSRDGKALLKPYNEWIIETENADIPLPVYNKYNNKVEYKTIGELIKRTDNIAAGYQLHYDKDAKKYSFTVKGDAMDPYSGSKNTIAAGFVNNVYNTAMAEDAKPYIERRNTIMMQDRLAKLSIEKGEPYSAVVFGDNIPDDPEKSYAILSEGLTNNLDILQKIDTYLSMLPTEKRKVIEPRLRQIYNSSKKIDAYGNLQESTDKIYW